MKKTTQLEFIEYLNQFIEHKIDTSKFSDDFLKNEWILVTDLKEHFKEMLK